MAKIFETIDRKGRKVYLTNERYKHILKHPYTDNILQEIEEALKIPLTIAKYSSVDKIEYFYRHYKFKKQIAKYLRVIVKYLNGEGFIITAYWIDKIR